MDKFENYIHALLELERMQELAREAKREAIIEAVKRENFDLLELKGSYVTSAKNAYRRK